MINMDAFIKQVVDSLKMTKWYQEQAQESKEFEKILTDSVKERIDFIHSFDHIKKLDDKYKESLDKDFEERLYKLKRGCKNLSGTVVRSKVEINPYHTDEIIVTEIIDYQGQEYFREIFLTKFELDCIHKLLTKEVTNGV